MIGTHTPTAHSWAVGDDWNHSHCRELLWARRREVSVQNGVRRSEKRTGPLLDLVHLPDLRWRKATCSAP